MRSLLLVLVGCPFDLPPTEEALVETPVPTSGEPVVPSAQAGARVEGFGIVQELEVNRALLQDLPNGEALFTFNASSDEASVALVISDDHLFGAGDVYALDRAVEDDGFGATVTVAGVFGSNQGSWSAGTADAMGAGTLTIEAIDLQQQTLSLRVESELRNVVEVDPELESFVITLVDVTLEGME